MRLAPDTRPTMPTSRTKRSQSGKFSETMFVTPNAPTDCRRCVRLAFFVVSFHGHALSWSFGVSFSFEREYALPIVLHACESPLVSFCLSTPATGRSLGFAPVRRRQEASGVPQKQTSRDGLPRKPCHSMLSSAPYVFPRYNGFIPCSGRHTESRHGWWMCQPAQRGARPDGNAGSSSARRGVSRL